MKKKIALGLALALAASVGTTAFAAAANPFTDVPAKHWSYGAIQQLAKAGIVEGYNDGEFKGDKTITRYEMAVIVAKAMAKEDKADAAQKATIDKLAAEFSSELDNLGVRVTNLENKVGNIKLSADARVRYDNTKTASAFKDRLRLNMNAQINDNTSFYGRYVFTDGKFQQSYGDDNATDKAGNRLADLAFTTKGLVSNTDVTLGRYTLNLGPTTFFSGTTGGVEGIQTNTTVGKFGLMLGYADSSYYLGTQSTVGGYTTTAGNGAQLKNIEYAEAKYSFDNVTINADYFKNIANNGVQEWYKIFGGGVTYKLGSDWKLIGEYYQNSAQLAKDNYGSKSPKAYIARVAYKGAQAAVPGTWGVFVEKTEFQKNALPYDLTGPYTKVGNFTTNGLKSYDINVNYTLAKNITFEGVYQWDMKDIAGNDASSKNFTRAQINYFF